ncbi:GNAT family N-acetyltransferase [Tenacibaculum sp. C7A-26P2]|uniref:GNAT family N-acetyltransferase n=1 Tax=Tenacibaculum sp. C7A-26P2 TaxID=3447504 RepID=UPI003F84CD0A
MNTSIIISDLIKLSVVKTSDVTVMYALMKEVYSLAYGHFWKDNGNWFVQKQYGKQNILKEILEKNTEYYFVLYKNEIIGNMRIIWDEPLKNFSQKKIVKLQRIYLHPKVHGLGVGSSLLMWIENKAKKKQYEFLWLDTMNEKPQAFNFYKRKGFQYHSHCFLDFNLLHDSVKKMNQVVKDLR